PYVRAIDLQTELWKQGLNVHVVSCGANHSILASAAAAWGYGLTGASMGYSARNLMGLEWVDPSGDIIRFGTAGQDKGWFCMDGPGPGVRGLVRGFHGTFGSLGTFTKCGVKLYRWDGPKEVRHSGKSPRYLLETPLPNTEFFVLAFPEKQNICDAGYQLGEAECNYADFRLPAFFISMGFTDNNLDLKKIWETGIFQKFVKYALVVCVHGHSKREFDWKVKALKQITKQNMGLRIPLLDPPVSLLPAFKPLMGWLDNPLGLAQKIPFVQEMIDRIPIPAKTRQKMQSSMFQLLLRHTNNVQGCFRPSSCMFTSVGSFDTWDLGFEQSDFIAKIKQPAISQGAIVDDDGDLGCGGTFESGHLGYLEGIGLFSSHKEESVKATQKIVEAGAQGAIDHALGFPLGAFGGPMNELFGPHCGNYHLVLQQIKAILDPNSSCDSWAYTGPSEKAFPDEKSSFSMY
ncbi:MAG: FAD-binding oxidoreductase, partial [Desulfatibacillum sp.]|nr:FAD-binding oxidoreductase [Desulfatibacillum sp.]